jgi:hypothetical protein
MIAFLGITGALIASAVGGYILHMIFPLARLKDWAAWLLGKIGLKLS